MLQVTGQTGLCGMGGGGGGKPDRIIQVIIYASQKMFIWIKVHHIYHHQIPPPFNSILTN